MLRNISLSNFQKHASLEVEFSSGSTVIVGDNWRGKSTLVRAIQYALFGPGVIPGGVKVLQSRGKKAKPKVVLNFSVNGNEYCVTRSSSTTRLVKDGDIVATGANPVTSYVEELIGLPGKLFVDLRTAPQDEAGSILTLGSAKLGGLLDAATQVDVVDRVISSASEQASSLGEKISQEEEIDLAEEEKNLWERYNETQAELEKLTKAQAAAAQGKKDLESASKHYSDLSGRREKAQEIRQSLGKLQGQETILTKRVQDLRVTLESIPISSKEVIAEQERNYTEGSKKFHVEADKIAKFKTKDTELRARKTLLMEQDLGVVERLSDCKRTLAGLIKNPWLTVGLRSKETLLKTSMASLKLSYDNKKKDLESSVCSACGRPFDEGTHDPEAMRMELEDIREQYLAAGKELYEVGQELEQKEKENAALEAAQEALKKAADKHTQNFSALEELDLSIDFHSKSKPEHTSGLSERLDKIFQLLEQEKKYRSYRVEKNKELNKEVSALEAVQERIRILEAEDLKAVSAEDVQRAHQLFSAANQAVVEASTEARGCSERYQAATNTYTRARELYTKLAASAKAQEKDRTRQILLTRLRGYLRKNRDAFTSQVWGSLLSYASDFVSQATSGAVTKIGRDAQGQFSYFEDGQEMPIQMASGLQRAIIGVAVRLALAGAVGASVRFFLLDEPTAGASDANSMAVAQALSRTGLQIVMVTHRQADTAVADGTISL